VAVSFPVNADNSLQGMQVTLSQDGSTCPLTGRIDSYQGIPEITKALSEGMTPVVSFWSADDMTWLDGKGPKGGACDADHADQCPDSVRVSGFSFEKGAGGSAPAAPPASNAITPVPQAAAPPAPAPASNVILPLPEPEDPDWKAYPGKDAYAGLNANDMEMSAADLGACKQYALANSLDAFVVWQGKAYFRSQSGLDVLQHLVDSNEHTTYIYSPAGAQAVPEFQAVPEMSAAAVPEVQVAGSGVSEPQAAAWPATATAGYPGWYPATDSSGGIYFYNDATGQTSWTWPPQ
jgi:hypothetical protein